MNDTVKSTGSMIASTVAISAGKKILSKLGFAGVAKLAMVAGAGYLAYNYFLKDKIELPEKVEKKVEEIEL